MNRIVLTNTYYEDVSLHFENGAFIQTMMQANDGVPGNDNRSFFEKIKSMLVDAGKHVVNDIVGATKKDRLTLAFLENLRAICFIFDPYRGNSLSQ